MSTEKNVIRVAAKAFVGLLVVVLIMVGLYVAV